VSLSRVEKRIQELCSKAASASEPELKPILSELKAALREHTRHLRLLAAEQFNRSIDSLQSELTRRKHAEAETVNDRQATS